MSATAVTTWDNPYERQTTHRAQAAAENHKRVQRRKKEAAIMRGLIQNVGLTVDDLEKLHEEEQSNKVKAREEQQRAVAAQKQQEEEDQERPPPVQCVGCFDAKVRCLETTHGGATIWSGHDDGTIAIRNGVTGEAVYVLEPALPDEDETEQQQQEEGNGTKTEGEEGAKKEEGGTDKQAPAVTTLYNAESHMWVGLADGTIRIYDSLVYVLAFESKMHNGPITCFANTFDAKVFSASEDGTLIKWDTEVGNFEVLAHLKDNPFTVRCLTTYGYNAFAGGDGNVIQQFDTETCAEVHRYEGHTGTINAVIVAEGFLVSAADDNKVVIWSIDTAQAFHEITAHTAPVKSLFVDNVAQRVWSTDDSGVVNIWGMNPSLGFPILSCFQTDEEAAIHSIKGVVAVDAVKLWSLGSDGNNKVWHSATNRIEAQTNIAVDAMRAIIAEDAIELAKWNELIKTMKAVAEKLKRSMATTYYTVATVRNDQRECFLLWVQWLLKRYSSKKRTLIISQLERSKEQDLLRRYYNTLQRYQAQRKEAKWKETLAKVVADADAREKVAEYYRKIRSFALLMRDRKKRDRVASQLCARSDNLTLATYYRKWQEALRKGQGRRKKEQMAAAFGHASNAGLRRLYFQKWLQSQVLRKRREESAATAAGLCLRRDNQLMGAYFQTWLNLAAKKRLIRNRAQAVAIMIRHASRNILSEYYGKWQRFALEHTEAKQSSQFVEGQTKYKELLEQMKGIEHLVRRRKLLDDAQAAIDAATAERDRRLAMIAELKAEIEDGQKNLAEKRAGLQAKKEQTLAEQVEDLMAKLKVKVLNFHHDYTLIHKMQERIKADKGSVVKLFLEGHISVKKVVVDITQQTYLDTEKEWPLSEEMIKKMKPHNNEPVLNAIKTMVVAFDTMTPEDRASMTTDAEIVLNAKWLALFAQVCVEQRIKKLGKAGSFRVK